MQISRVLLCLVQSVLQLEPDRQSWRSRRADSMASLEGFCQMSQIQILMLAALDDVFLQIALKVFQILPFDFLRTCRAFDLTVPSSPTWGALQSVSLRV
jgi:hypothetical protein